MTETCVSLQNCVFFFFVFFGGGGYRDVEIFLDMTVSFTDFDNLVSLNNKICNKTLIFVRMKFCKSNLSVWHFDITGVKAILRL